MTETRFEPTGELLTYTTVWVGRAGLTPPYTLGQVKLDEGPLVFGHVRGLSEGTRVPLAVRLELATVDAAVPPFWFVPSTEDG